MIGLAKVLGLLVNIGQTFGSLPKLCYGRPLAKLPLCKRTRLRLVSHLHTNWELVTPGTQVLRKGGCTYKHGLNLV